MQSQVVANRVDGSFATGDLYAKHPTIRNAWRYCGRVDDIIVMVRRIITRQLTYLSFIQDKWQESFCQSHRDSPARFASHLGGNRLWSLTSRTRCHNRTSTVFYLRGAYKGANS